MAEEKLVVMISSTARDLPDYREQVEDACLRLGMFPKMMDHLPALDTDAIKASLDMVNEADVYVGLFAHRYGYVPEGHEISITQMEYERAVELKIPRLIFLMHDDVPVLPKDFDKEEATVKLNTLKDRLKKEHVVNFFENPDDLRAKVILSLGKIQKGGKKGKGYRPDPPPKPRNKLLHYLANRDILKTNLRIALECYRAHNSTAPFVCIMQGNRDDCIDKFIECLLSPDRDLEEAGVIPKALLWDEGPQKKRIRWPGGNKFKHYGVTQRKAYWFQMFFNKIEPKAKGARELAKAIEENKITQPLFVHTHIVTPHGTDEHAVLEKLLEEWAGFGSIGVHLIVFIIVHYKKEEPIVEETDSEYPSKRWWERLLNLFQSDRASQKKREQQIQEHVEAQAYDTKIRTYLETLTKIKEKQDKIDYSIAFKVSGEHLAGIWLGCLPELEKGDVKEFFGVHAERLGLGDKSEQELEEMVETWYKKADSLSMQAFVDKLEAIQQPNV